MTIAYKRLTTRNAVMHSITYTEKTLAIVPCRVARINRGDGSGGARL